MVGGKAAMAASRIKLKMNRSNDEFGGMWMNLKSMHTNRPILRLKSLVGIKGEAALKIKLEWHNLPLEAVE